MYIGNKMSKGTLVLGALLLHGASATSSFAQQSNNFSTVVPSAQSDLSTVVANPDLKGPGTGDLVVSLGVSCKGVNLRSVSSVLRPTGAVRLMMSSIKDGVETKYNAIPFSPSIVYQQTSAALQAVWNQTVDQRRAASLEGVASSVGWGELTTVMEGAVPLDVELSPSGVMKPQDFSIKYVFQQNVGGNWINISPLTQQAMVSPDGGLVRVESTFAGSLGFCGGYISPLMLFFDNKRPEFSGVSEFPIFPGAKTYWPEKGAAGYFLARLTKGEKAITKASQLFGNDKAANGFESLAVLDKNKDKKISKQELNELVLWQDANGDGVSQVSEITKLSQYGITEISLAYNNDDARIFGERAKIVETAKFHYQKDGQDSVGLVADVWFRPILK